MIQGPKGLVLKLELLWFTTVTTSCTVYNMEYTYPTYSGIKTKKKAGKKLGKSRKKTGVGFLFESRTFLI